MNTKNYLSTTSFNSFNGYYNNVPIKGIKNETILPKFVEICKRTQKELKEWLPNKLEENGYTEIICDNGYIYAKGNLPVLLTAHMDTVHKETVKDFYERTEDGNHILSSPEGIGGDDRCGIYMILEIIKTHKCSVLFCEDEEIGGVGSNKFAKSKYIDDLKELNYLIELDRANKNDAVFYDCDNEEFTEFILNNTGYKEAYGSFSDISILSPACKIASVNLSCGYYKAHSLLEEVVIEEMQNTIETVKKLLDVESKQFEYIEADYGYYGYGYGYMRNHYANNYYPSSNYYSNSDYYSGYNTKEVLLLAYTNEKDYYSYGKTSNEAWRKLFINNPNLCYNDILDYEIVM